MLWNSLCMRYRSSVSLRWLDIGIAFSLTEKEVNIQLSCLLNYLGGGGRLGDPEARPLGTFETNHKMARRSYRKIGDCERSISAITDCN